MADALTPEQHAAAMGQKEGRGMSEHISEEGDIVLLARRLMQEAAKRAAGDLGLASLPVVTSCEGCGACCMTQGSPPGVLYHFGHPDSEVAEAEGWPRHLRPLSVWGRSLPPELAAELFRYHEGLDAGTAEDRGAAGIPCLWLDVQTRRCRHYEHRPEACREVLQPGDAICLAWRQDLGIRTP